MTDTLNYSIRNPELRPEPGAPLLALCETVLFPYSLTPVTVEGELNAAAVQQAMKHQRLLAVFSAIPAEPDPERLPPGFTLEEVTFQQETLSATGMLVRIVKRLQFPDGATRILVRGIRRIRWEKLIYQAGVPEVLYREFPEPEDRSLELQALRRNATLRFQALAALQPGIPEELKVAVLNVDSAGRLADLLADSLPFDYLERLALQALPSARERLQFLALLLNREVEISQLGMKIQSEVQQSLSRSQREYFLREQLRSIQQELGEETRNPDLVEIEERLQTLALPEKVEEVVRKELSRLEIMPQAAPEYHIAYTYICWLLDVPWNTFTEDRLDVAEAEQVLEHDHYGLKDVKERILEFLAVLQLKKDRKSPILCLVGPPGVGKTSLGQSIARALNRNFVRIALGGVRDEAEIRGHRRTYIGALPGRIIQSLKKAGSANPVFMLDEIDKLASDVRGDPASALLEVLDPAQNSTFNDHYLELDFDLSRVFFIATANLLDTIPPPLQDRMEIIRLPGYTSYEKREIARRYLVPRQIRENGFKTRQLRFTMAAIDELIDYYTREAGVRQLERTIAQICRKLARRLVEGKISPTGCTSVTAELVQELLGPRKFLLDEAGADSEPGNAIGMAWTSCGGTILPIEVLSMPGKGNLKLTGSLGKVMQESAEAAFSLIRNQAGRWGIAPETFEKNDFHIHVPDGATPKDGPSAGITLATALLSLLTGRPVRPYLSMTGEITLQGKVTAVGGIREKVIAALRAGIETVIMPEDNRKDTEEIAPEIRKKLKFIYVRRFQQVAEAALLPPDPPEPTSSGEEK